MVHDFNLQPSWIWAQNLVEGTYQLQITARDNTTGEQNSVIIPYAITSRVTGGAAVVTATSHPPWLRCSAHRRVRRMDDASRVFPQGKINLSSSTDSRPCGSGSMNFLIGGMYGSTTYDMNYLVTTNGVTTQGPQALQFTTGVPSSAHLIKDFVSVPASSATSLKEKIVLTAYSYPYVARASCS